MKTYLSLLIFSLLTSLTAFADPAGQTVKIVQVLKGDTVIVALRGSLGSAGGSGLYVHLAGIDAPNPDQSAGPQSKDYLTKLALNQKAYLVIVKQQGNQSIGRLYLGDGGTSNDLSAQMVQAGWAFFRDEDESGLSSVQRASFSSLAERAKYKRLGLWANGDLNYTMTADSFRDLATYRLNQQYTNGHQDPNYTDYNRPSIKKDPADWRTVGKNKQ
jgi:endonuclease YncB( thermonuclease family)